ncbi:MAG: PD40 domain-containing protein, partial [Acidobacteriota bacterium]|nr:PD40 domain-containing protein [Acidobacteriota bacterium]
MRQARPLSFSPDGSQLLIASNEPGSDQLFVWPGMRRVTFD